MWKWYQNCLAVHPVKTQVISSGLIWGAGDIAAQAVTHYTAKKRVTFDAVFYCVVSFKDFVFGQMGVCVCVFCLVNVNGAEKTIWRWSKNKYFSI